MYRSLHFKITLIFAVFMVTVMAVVGVVLLHSVFGYYSGEFVSQLDAALAEGTRLHAELTSALESENHAPVQKQMIAAYAASLGIDNYRNYYILDMDGDYLAGSDDESGRTLAKTRNLIAAMKRGDGRRQELGAEHADYAVWLASGTSGRECIIYIKDTMEEMSALARQIFTIILQSVFFGMLIAAVLSFFLARAITSPIRSLTRDAQLVAAGEFEHEIKVRATDEIGVLTATFNEMKQVLKRTLHEITGERMKLETILTCMRDALIAYSDNGRPIHINDSAIELLGSDRMTLGEMMKELDIEYADSYVKSLSPGHTVVLRGIVAGDRALDVSFSPLRYVEDGKSHNGCLAILQDISNRYKLEKAQREFVANVSHELRTPLTVIKASTESVMMYPDMDGSMREMFLGNIIEESDRMLRIVSDLLTLSRLDNRRTKWQVSSFDMRERLRHICSILQISANAKNQNITLDCPNPLPMTADRERLEQVITNIVSNSMKYTQEGGEIAVIGAVVNRDIVIRVRDNGAGIPEEDLPRIFERFYRVEKARTSDTGGTGLGLAIAKEIVEAHGGTIAIKSRLGKGTEVIIRLPEVSALPKEDPQKSPDFVRDNLPASADRGRKA